MFLKLNALTSQLGLDGEETKQIGKVENKPADITIHESTSSMK